MANISTLALLICLILHILITFDNVQLLNDNFRTCQVLTNLALSLSVCRCVSDENSHASYHLLVFCIRLVFSKSSVSDSHFLKTGTFNWFDIVDFECAKWFAWITVMHHCFFLVFVSFLLDEVLWFNCYLSYFQCLFCVFGTISESFL